MATARLVDSQKQELVRRFREGESTQALADHFGCSATTITRLVRAELGDKDYAVLRDRRQKKAGRDRQIPLAISDEPDASSVASEAPREPTTPAAAGPISRAAGPTSLTAKAKAAQTERNDQEASWHPSESPAAVEVDPPGDQNDTVIAADQHEEPLEADDDEPLAGDDDKVTVLAIDDADDFADDGDSEDDLLTTDEDGEGDEDGPLDSQSFHPVAVLPIVVDDQRETRPAPWTPDVLPSCAYLLVDKTVELQARPLGDIPELGRLPMEEQDQQALVLFTNPRQAKRHCGRTQRVIKLPDPALLGRTAPYLRAQGISRVVIEGALYALPGEQ
ncbi:MAG: helix-turn-helix domain-containing protein [Cyanobacteriota bacterium]|nr:helix-turn-helix domain-containing protein [Cyanobacteriota bacterium]